MHCISIDETSNDPESFKMRYGYSPIGEECIVNQFIIGGRSFSTICAACPLGIRYYRIKEGINTGDDFIDFLEELSFHLVAEDFGILDNCSIHKRDDVRVELERVFQGDYLYIAKYSPHLNPIERIFALVKNHIRDNEEEALVNPEAFLNRAFTRFSVGGEGAESVFGHWDDYFRANELFERE